MKKFLMVILAFTMVISLAGCGANDNTSSEATEATQPVYGKSDYTYESNPNGSITLTGYTGYEKYLDIPAIVDNLKVTAIGDGCFAGNIYLEKVHVPEGVSEIGDYAFECCSVLKKIYLPDSIIKIGDGAFSGCCSLYMADFQDGVEEIGKGAFLECTSLVNFVAPKALKTIGNFAFANCTNLTNADFAGSSLEGFSDRCFMNCENLTKVGVPETLKAVGKRAFAQCEKLILSYLPESTETVAEYAFDGCISMEGINISCKVIEPYTFESCLGLNWVNFGAKTEKICKNAFRNTKFVINEEDIKNENDILLTIPENIIVEEGAFGVAEDPLEETEDNNPAEEETENKPEIKADITARELEDAAKKEGLSVITGDDFEDWAENYLKYNANNALLTRELNPYITKYKAQINGNYRAMTAVASGNKEAIEEAKGRFGDDFEEMYAMINHGLATEISRFRMEDSLLLYTGVYDYQLMKVTGTDQVPTLEELKACIGKTFTDTTLTSTTTEAGVAFGFGDTIFVIHAPSENLNSLGCVCMDAYMHSNENEILLNSGAEYEVLGAGIVSEIMKDCSGQITGTETRNYVELQLIS